MKKTLVAEKDLPKDHIIEINDIGFRSPGGKMECYEANLLIGKKLNKNVSKYHNFTLEDVDKN